MRSRFSAFAVGDVSYLLSSWHPLTRPSRLSLDADIRWTRLEILGTEQGGALDNEGTVSFVAHGKHRDKATSQAEVSRFLRHEGRWTYLAPMDIR